MKPIIKFLFCISLLLIPFASDAGKYDELNSPEVCMSAGKQKCALVSTYGFTGYADPSPEICLSAGEQERFCGFTYEFTVFTQVYPSYIAEITGDTNIPLPAQIRLNYPTGISYKDVDIPVWPVHRNTTYNLLIYHS